MLHGWRLLASCALVALLGTSVSGAGEPDLLHLTLGDPARKGRDVPLVLDAVVDTATGDALSPGELVDRLAGVKLLIVGESHTAIEAHRVEARVIDLLARRGRRVLVGVEMFPYTAQDWLDAWNANLVTEAGFLHLSHWYRYWGFPWQYYRDVFVSARNNDARIVAINAPLDVVRAVRQKGFKNLTTDEAAHIPRQIDVDSPEQLTLFRASFASDDSVHGGGSDESWKKMLSAQATWDAAMAFNAVKALSEMQEDNAIMVVIAGSGHVEYGLGIQHQAQQWFKGRIATLIPVPVRHTGGSSQTVRASYADFVWGIPSEMYPAYPDLGITLAGGETPAIIEVTPDSPADLAGLEPGDRLLAVDGAAIDDDEVFNSLMATKRWGDTAAVVVRRGDTTLTVRADFRRVMPGATVARR